MFKYRVMKRKEEAEYGIQWWAWFWPFWTWQTWPADGGAWTYLTYEKKEDAEAWIQRTQDEARKSKMRKSDWEEA